DEKIGFGAALRFVAGDPSIRATTVMFMLFNVGFGGVIVLLPVYTRHILGAGAGTYGLLLSIFTAGELLGSAAVGAIQWRWPLARTIAITQLTVGICSLAFVPKPSLPVAAVILALVGALSAPLTIWAQTLRMRAIPAAMRGRVFALLRTGMQGATPAGA